MIRVVVDRKRWYRGKGADGSRLLIPEGRGQDSGKMCCIGFACLAAGCGERDIAGANYANSIDPSVLPASSSLRDEWHRLAAFHNDDADLSDAEREAKIIKLGSANGFSFVFEN